MFFDIYLFDTPQTVAYFEEMTKINLANSGVTWQNIKSWAYSLFIIRMQTWPWWSRGEERTRAAQQKLRQLSFGTGAGRGLRLSGTDAITWGGQPDSRRVPLSEVPTPAKGGAISGRGWVSSGLTWWRHGLIHMRMGRGLVWNSHLPPPPPPICSHQACTPLINSEDRLQRGLGIWRDDICLEFPCHFFPEAILIWKGLWASYFKSFIGHSILKVNNKI